MPDSLCKVCGQAYSRWGDAFDTFYCPACHKKKFARSSRYDCPVCGERKLYYKFLWNYQDHFVRDFHLCCETCAPVFNALSFHDVLPYIRLALQRTYPSGQVIYVLRESDTREIRYVGRTAKPEVRLRQHKQAAHHHSYEDAVREFQALSLKEQQRMASSFTYTLSGPKYTEGYWLYDLNQRRAYPVMDIVERVEDGPLVVERELLWICHLIQAHHQLVNTCAYDAELVTKVRQAAIDFLHQPLPVSELVPLSHLVGQKAQLVEFIRRYYCATL